MPVHQSNGGHEVKLPLLFFTMIFGLSIHNHLLQSHRIVDPAYMGNIEPNTGTMLIRATNQGLKLMEKFLLRLVNVNKANDQPYFNPELGNVRITSDCQYLYGKTFDENILFGKDSQYGNITNAISRSAGDRSDNSSNREDATMCYLPGLLFQNGFMAFTCSGKEKSKEVSA